MWFHRDALGCEQLGLTILELEPGAEGKEHDHTDENHEEVYCVVDGELTVEAEGEGETVTLGENEAVRVGPDTTRQLFNRGDDRVRVVIAGAP